MPPRRGHRLLVALFVVYLVLLAWLVLWKFEVPWLGGGGMRTIKLIPFASDGNSTSNTLRESAANVAFFVPFGMYLGMLAPKWRWWSAGLVVASSSLVLELLQFVLAIGSTDVTDLVTNTAGGLVGFWIVRLLRRRMPAAFMRVMTVVCLTLTVVGVLATVLFVVSPLRYAPMDRGAPIVPSVEVDRI